MNEERKWFGLVTCGIVALAVAVAGPLGCSDDDDDDGGGANTTVVVVTNQVDGTVVTNVVVVTNAPPAADPQVLNVAGTWTGNFQTDIGQGQLQVQLVQAGSDLVGQFRINTGGPDQVGNATGNVSGDRVVLMLDVTANDRWMELDGNANASATIYNGNLTGFYGQGQFALSK